MLRWAHAKTTPGAFVTDHAHRSRLIDHRYSQSLERGLSVLGCFTAAHPVLGINELSDMLGLSRSTTHRYTVTLAELGYLEQTKDRRYRLGLRVTDLGIAALGATGLRDSAAAALRQLALATGLTAGLAVLNGDRVLYVERVPGDRVGRHAVDRALIVGSQTPIWSTAAGRVLLAHLSKGEREAHLDQTEDPRTLRQDLQFVRDRHFAVDDQQLADGLVGIATAVRDSDGEVVAAADVLARADRIDLDELIPVLGPRLLRAAEDISAGLGHVTES